MHDVDDTHTEGHTLTVPLTVVQVLHIFLDRYLFYVLTLLIAHDAVLCLFYLSEFRTVMCLSYAYVG